MLANQCMRTLHSLLAGCALQLEIVDPGIVLMWIFGSILGLLWLLFVFYGE